MSKDRKLCHIGAASARSSGGLELFDPAYPLLRQDRPAMRVVIAVIVARAACRLRSGGGRDWARIGWRDVADAAGRPGGGVARQWTGDPASVVTRDDLCRARPIRGGGRSILPCPGPVRAASPGCGKEPQA